MHHRLNLSSRTDSFIDFEAEIGKNPRLFAELYQPLGADSPFFVSPSLELERSNLLLRSSGDVVAEYERLTGVSQLLFGREISSLGEAAIGVRRGFGDLEKSIGDNALPEFGYDIGETVAAVRLDAFDTPDFPTSGYAFRLAQTSSLETLGAGDEYHDITGKLAKAYSWGRNTISYTGDFGLTFNDRPVERSFSLGGFLDISGFAPNSLLASDFHVQRLLYYRRFSELKMPLFGFGFFAGASLEYADLRSDISAVPDERNIWAGSVFIGADTPLLPTYFGVGLGDGDEFSFYLAIGRLGTKRR